MIVRPASEEDTADLLGVERAAFGGDEEADLVAALLADPSAVPLINLVAHDAGEIVGHVLFTHATVESDGDNVEATILAPLAVAPSAQRIGVGQALSREGIRIAGDLGIGLVFVLGHPGYYPRLGFTPATPLGLHAPYPITPAEAWMVLETRPHLLGSVRGVVRCADVMMQPEMWRE